jgi:alpha-ribazole phosphatase/probable phosphoglycerate mutase
MRQIERVAEYLKDKEVSAVYCSDLLRARRGAGAIARHHDLAAEAFLEFREIKMGIWEGLTFGEIQERYPEEVESKFDDFINYRVRGGENVIDVRNRAIPKIRELIALNRGGEIVLVGHGGMNMVLLCDAINLDLENFFRIIQGNGCLNIIDYFDDTAVVRLINGFTEGAVLPNT